MWNPHLNWDGVSSDGTEVNEFYRPGYNCTSQMLGYPYHGYDSSPYSEFYKLPSFSRWSSAPPYYGRVCMFVMRMKKRM